MTIDMRSPALQNRANDVMRVLANKENDLAQEEHRLAKLERELVELNNQLKRAEKACAVTLDNRPVEKIREEISYITSRRDTAARIAKSFRANLEAFLAEGEPTNKELVEASKAFEDAEMELRRL